MGELLKAMTWLGEQPDTIFLGQSVLYPGAKTYASLEGVPRAKCLEMPVAEALQLGISIGLSLEGFTPVSIFPRINFLLCATDMLVNHLDKLPLFSDYRPKVIIRTIVGAKAPLDAGPQHTGDYTRALASMLETMHVRRLYDGADAEHVMDVYQEAYRDRESTLVVEG